MRRRRSKTAEPHPRRGSLYVSVMAVAFIVSVVSLSGLHLARLHLKAAVGARQRAQAHILATSAIEHAISEFNRNSNWQTDYSLNIEYPLTPVGVNNGTFTWKRMTGPGGTKELHGIGRVGDVTSVYAVDLGVAGNSYLDSALMCGGNLWIGEYTSAEKLSANATPVATNATLRNWGVLTADAEGQSIINSGTITGTQTAPATPRGLPQPSSVFDYYMANGTVINVTSIQNQLLSPFNNPYGTPNSLGIYIINAGGFSVSLKRCRIVGTLVVRNASSVAIDEEMNWEPAVPNYPALMVEGSIELRLSHYKLREADISRNLNPLLTPYQGQTDVSSNDEYPSSIAGIIYCTGNLAFDGKNDNLAPKYQGTIITHGSCVLRKSVDVSILHDETLSTNPPPGFGVGNPKAIVPGTWRQIPSS